MRSKKMAAVQSFLPSRLRSSRVCLRVGTALVALLTLSYLNNYQIQHLFLMDMRMLHDQQIESTKLDIIKWGSELLSPHRRVLQLRSRATAEHNRPQSRRKSLQEFEQEWEDLANRFYRPTNDTASSTTRNQHTRLQELDIITALGFPTALLEMEDGRELWCLDSYHYLWSKEVPFSGQPFFEWLNDTDIESEECSRARLNRRRYVKFNATQIEESVVELRSLHNAVVQVVFAHNQEPVPDGTWLTVWGVDERLYMLRDTRVPTENGEPFEYYTQGHCSVTHGRPVLYAGEMSIFHQGIVVFTFPNSGHYRPGVNHSLAFRDWMVEQVGDVARKRIQWMPCEICLQNSGRGNATREEWEALFAAS